MLSWNELLADSRRKDKGAPSGVTEFSGRYEIERDYDRILFAAPTRRLADKTQVYPLDKNDSVRNRLTHSHEVSALARSIGLRLVYEKREIFAGIESEAYLQRSVPALLAAIGLVHDLGNPPFGHQGEYAIQDWFKTNQETVFADAPEDSHDFVNFDGNAQTVRLVTRLQLLNDSFGLNLTYATLAALIKYPVGTGESDSDKWKKQGFFKSEKDIVEEVWGVTGLQSGVRHPLTYVMEACDDIAYSVLDAEDTVKKGLASYYDLIRFLEKSCGDDPVSTKVISQARAKSKDFEDASLSPQELNDCAMQMFRVYAITAMVNAVVDKFSELADRYLARNCTYKGIIAETEASLLCKVLKKFDYAYGFRHKSVLELELKGNGYIKGVMDMLWVGIHGRLTKEYGSQSPFGKYVYSRISENYRRVFEDPENLLSAPYKEAQLLADSVSGMTDSYLVSLHDELSSFYERHCS